MLNDAIAEDSKENLVTKLRVAPFSIAIDGSNARSNDTGPEKMNPMTVKLFDINSHKVQQRFLDMCTTNSGTADEIFQKMNDVFKENDLTWNQCVGLSADNTGINLGIRNGLKAKILRENENVNVMGCPCHKIHNTAMKANKAFLEECDFDTEDFSIDNF